MRKLVVKRKEQQQQAQQNQGNNNNRKPKKKQGNKQRIEGGTSNYGKQLGMVVDKGYGATLKMYPSTQMFARVYGDPFLKDSARLPVFPIRATKMLRVMTSASGVLNNTGIGFVTVQPMNSIISDVPSLFYSNNPASPPFFTTDTGAYLIGASFAASQYTSPDFWYGINGKTVRIVAQAIRVRYVGTTLNAAGSCYCAQASPEQSISTFGIDDVKKQLGWKEYVFSDRAWHSICRHMTTLDDQDYQYLNKPDGKWYYYNGGSNSTKDNVDYYGMLMTGVPGQPFEIEVCTHVELVAPSLDQTRVSMQDAQGVSHVVSSYAKSRNKDNTSVDHSVGTQKWINILQNGIETATTIGKAILPFFL